MTPQDFEVVLGDRLRKIKEVLSCKGAEYASASDRLHNFKMAAAIQRIRPEQALLDMLAKHLVSVVDMIQSGRLYSSVLWEEKIGDSVNYLILLEALVKEKDNAVTRPGD